MTKEEFTVFVVNTLNEVDWDDVRFLGYKTVVEKIVNQWEQDIFEAWKLGEQVEPGLPQGVYRTGEDL